MYNERGCFQVGYYKFWRNWNRMLANKNISRTDNLNIEIRQSNGREPHITTVLLLLHGVRAVYTFYPFKIIPDFPSFWFFLVFFDKFRYLVTKCRYNSLHFVIIYFNIDILATGAIGSEERTANKMKPQPGKNISTKSNILLNYHVNYFIRKGIIFVMFSIMFVRRFYYLFYYMIINL